MGSMLRKQCGVNRKLDTDDRVERSVLLKQFLVLEQCWRTVGAAEVQGNADAQGVEMRLLC